MVYRCANCKLMFELGNERTNGSDLYCPKCFALLFKKCGRAGCFVLTQPAQTYCSDKCTALERKKVDSYVYRTHKAKMRQLWQVQNKGQ